MDESLIAAVVATVLVLGGAVALLLGRRGSDTPGAAPSAGDRDAAPAAREPVESEAAAPALPTEEPPDVPPPSAGPPEVEPPPVEPPAPEARGAGAPEVEPPDVEPPQVEAPTPAAAEAEPATPRTPQDEVSVLRKGLANTRGGFVARLARLFRREEPLDDARTDELEEVLLGADLGVHTADRLLERLKERLAGGGAEDDAWETLRDEARAILDTGATPMTTSGDPAVILVVGVNGVGKTTTIGKLAAKLTRDGKRVLLAAGDTFRAAAIPQLESWGRRVGVPVLSKDEGADPAALVFDAVRQAREDGIDVVLADTAGRLHTKTNLMEELAKVGRSASKALGGRPVDEILLVLDATTGQNAVQQAKLFKDALPITGLVLTKLDGTAKGGVVLGIVDQHGIPVRYVGIGEKVDDLREFDAESFVRALFDKTEDSNLAA